MKVLHRFFIALLAFMLWVSCIEAQNNPARAESAIPESAVLYAYACNDKWICMCDAHSKTYFWKKVADGSLIAKPSIEPLDGDAEGYRSCMALASDGSEIYSINATILRDGDEARFGCFELYRLSPEGEDRFIREIDLSQIVLRDEMGEYTLECTRARLSESWLCLLFEEEGGDLQNSKYRLIALNLESGRQVSHEMANVCELFSASDAKMQYAYLRENDGVGLAEISLENGGVRDYGALMEGVQADRLAYDAAAHAIYYAQGSRIYAVRQLGDAPKLVAYLPFAQAKYLHVLGGDRLLAVSDNDMADVQIDWNMPDAKTKLQISGWPLASFELAHPEIQLEQSRDMMPDETVTTILTRSEVPDVLSMNTASDQIFHALKNRGYLLPLENESVTDQIRQMYPAIQETVSIDGKICALPVELICGDALGYKPAVLEALDIENPPETWPEMVDLLNRWPVLSKENPEICLIHNGSEEPLRQLILRHMLSSYEIYRCNAKPLLGYDTPEFRALMDLYAQIDFDGIEAAGQVDDLPDALLMAVFDWSPISSNMEDGYPLILGIAEGMCGYLPASMFAYAINPNSLHPDESQEYLAFVAKARRADSRIQMTPDFNEPQREEGYQESVDSLRAEIQELEEALAKASPDAETTELQQKLSSAKAALPLFENSWAISAAAIEKYRSFADRIRIQTPIAVSNEEQMALDNSRTRFLRGEMETEAFIREMDRRIRMNAGEG